MMLRTDDDLSYRCSLVALEVGDIGISWISRHGIGMDRMTLTQNPPNFTTMLFFLVQNSVLVS